MLKKIIVERPTMTEDIYYSFDEGISEDARRIFFPNPALQTERLADDVLVLREQMKRLNEAFDELNEKDANAEERIFQAEPNAQKVKVQKLRAELVVEILEGDLGFDLHPADLLDALCEAGLELQPMNFNKWKGNIISSVSLAYFATIAPDQELALWVNSTDDADFKQ